LVNIFTAVDANKRIAQAEKDLQQMRVLLERQLEILAMILIKLEK